VSIQLEVETAKTRELGEQVAFWRGRATAAESQLASMELALQRAQRLQTQAELEAKDARARATAAQEAATLAQRAATEAEQRVR